MNKSLSKTRRLDAERFSQIQLFYFHVKWENTDRTTFHNAKY